MPASRWWQFEDAAVDLGRLEAAPDDLGRLLLTEFALVYGNDFFMVPMEAAPGSVSRVLSLTVDTSFGEQVSIPSAIAYDTKAKLGRWRMFHCDDGIPDQGTGAGLLVFPPTAIDVMTGPEVEDVLISRDEMANVAWAIERKVRSPLGTPVERCETEYAAHERAGVETSTTSILRYQLSTSVPDSWMPLVPVLGGFVELQGPNTPAGQLLSGGQPYRLQSTEVLRTGRRVTAHTHRARTVKGDVLLWGAGTSVLAAEKVPAAYALTTSPTRSRRLPHDQQIRCPRSTQAKTDLASDPVQPLFPESKVMSHGGIDVTTTGQLWQKELLMRPRWHFPDRVGYLLPTIMFASGNRHSGSSPGLHSSRR